jgi:hypothetical protein
MARLNKGKGNRNRTKVDESPAPTAGSSTGVGATPLSQVATIETVKDVLPVGRLSYATEYGYTFHDYDRMLPNDSRVMVMIRNLIYSPLGYHEQQPGNVDSATKILLGLDRIEAFMTDLYPELLNKAVIRDGYRHLPDTMDNDGIIGPYYGVFVGAVNNCRAVKVMIDNASWNDGTLELKSGLQTLFRRATEDWATLMTLQIPDLYRTQALLNPPLSDSPSGTVLISLVDISKHAEKLGTINSSHPAFILREGGATTTIDASYFKAILSEVEASIAILKFKPFVQAIDGDTGGGFTWSTSTGRGVRADIQYWITLVEELVYPMGLPDPGTIVVNPLRMADALYGECLYSMAETDTIGVPSSDALTAYPYFINADTDAISQLIYRRGFSPRNIFQEAGLDQIWMGLKSNVTIDDGAFFGAFIQVGPQSSVGGHGAFKYQGKSNNSYRAWKRTGWLSFISEVNFDDADDIKIWMSDGGPSADHQWNDSALNEGLITQTPIGMAAYSYFMPPSVPFELHRSALATTFGLPYIR